MNTEGQETRRTSAGMGTPRPPARPRQTRESKVDKRKADVEVKKLFLAMEEQKLLELLKITNLSMAAQQRAHHRRMTASDVPGKPFSLQRIFSSAAEVSTDATREKELKERAERRGLAAILKADFDADKSFWDGRILNEQKIKEENAKLMKANASILDEKRARRRQMKARTASAAEGATSEMREKELQERAERQGKAAVHKADFEAAELFRQEEKLKAQKRREVNMENMKFNMNMAAEQRARRQQMKVGNVPFEPFSFTDFSKTASAAENLASVAREKELQERAERQGKAAVLKADIEAAELFREEEKLKARKRREINVEHMKFNMNMAAEQRARRLQMKVGEVPFKPFSHRNIPKTTSAAEDPSRTTTDDKNRNPPQDPQPPVQPERSTSDGPKC